MTKMQSPGAGTGPDPISATVISVVNALTCNAGKGANSAAAAVAPKGDHGAK